MVSVSYKALVSHQTLKSATGLRRLVMVLKVVFAMLQADILHVDLYKPSN